MKTLLSFMEEHVYPAEPVYHRQLVAAAGRWEVPSIMEDLKRKARTSALWNLFLPKAEGGRLTNLEYAPLCEIMGRSYLAPEAFNCAAPDTGNMEILARFGTEAQKRAWLEPLLSGAARSCFAMTEPGVASSDATNIATSARRDGDDYVISGAKWWITNAFHPNCRMMIVMARTSETAPLHERHTMIVVPSDAPGVTVARSLTNLGYDDAPFGHGEVVLKDVRVPASNILLGEGRGFEIAQARLGPGRIHHCMRLIGLSERALELMCDRARSRIAFGRPIAEHGALRQEIAFSRMEIDQARLLTLRTAQLIDEIGAKNARKEIAMIKVVVPRMAQSVIDRAIQAHGAGGLSGDFPLAAAFASARSLRIADGPDAVHIESVAKLELGKAAVRGSAQS